MERMNLEEKLAELERIYEQLTEEYKEIDQVLRAIGFPYGMVSLKDVARELIKEAS